jgi:arylsulfatase A-like enzyme
MSIMTYQAAEDTAKRSFSFWNCFRLVFIIFFLYLIGDVFYRWDAFKLHSSFSQYLPNVALASIIWSIVALLSSLVVWLPLKVLERILGYLRLKIKAEHLVLFLLTFMSVAAFAWMIKKIIWFNTKTPPQLKIAVIVAITCTAMYLAWLFRRRAGLWFSVIAERITPLVWLFAVCVALSLLVAGYHLWVDTTNQELPHVVTAVPQADEKRPNILLVTFDALFARRMSVYGYGRETTPFIKKWAQSASVFTRTEAGSSYTAPTTSSIITGKRVWTHRKYQHDPAAHPLKSKTENLALVLKENGYQTSAFIVNGVASVPALGISNSIDYAPSTAEFSKPRSIEGFIEKYLSLLFGSKFSTYNWIGQDDFIFTIWLRKIDKKVFTTEVPPKLAFDRFLEVIDHNPRKPFFAWIHLFVPHAPYTPPRPFAGTFNSSWELREKNKIYSYNPEIRKYNNKINSDLLPFPEELKEKIKLLRDYYDEFILYSDKQFENFIDDLQKRNWFNNTVIIVSADHGESFYEHNYFQHGSPHLYEQVTNVPLIIKEPGQTEGRTIDDLVEQIDIPATILGLANIPVPSWMEGRSLLPLLHDEKLPAKTAIAVSLMQNSRTDPITIGTIAVWQNDYKLIHFLDNGRTLLFNLKKDPDELDNLIDKDADTGQQLLSFIRENLKEVNEKILADKQKIQ